MGDLCEFEDTDKKPTYTFRFGSTNKVIDVTEQELNGIPYLSVLVNQNKNFSSVQNEDGEYVLNSRIRYRWFVPILKYVTTGHPSTLFTELSQDAYTFGMLQLYDYLCLDQIPVPILKDQNLVRTKPDDIDDKKFRVEYNRVTNRLEVRDIAAQFIISLTRNEYDLDDSSTLSNIFSLIMIIVSNPTKFSVRLCHHLLTVMNKMCFQLFSPAQQRELQKAKKSIENIKNHSLIYFSDGRKILPNHFENVFVWKGIYVPIKEDNNTDCQSTSSQTLTNSQNYFERNFYDNMNLFTINFDFYDNIPLFRYDLEYTSNSLRDYLARNWFMTLEQEQLVVDHNRSMKEKKKEEVKSARLGYFNTLPKRSKIDKFKHRYGSKTQKHR